jgi:hypothetical protein
MKFRFTKVIGQTTFTFEDECNDPAEFFKKASFYSSELPAVGPNGENDLVIRHRVAKGYDFYSIESAKSHLELPFGQLKDQKGVLFPKGWKQIQRGKSTDEEDPYK